MAELRSSLSCIKTKVLNIKSNMYKVTNNSTTIENITKVKAGNIIFLSFVPLNNVYKNEFCSMYDASTISFIIYFIFYYEEFYTVAFVSILEDINGTKEKFKYNSAEFR